MDKETTYIIFKGKGTVLRAEACEVASIGKGLSGRVTIMSKKPQEARSPVIPLSFSN
jgi:hypothetical protein